MALDLRLEIFAYTLLHETWWHMGIVKTMPNALQSFGEECYKMENFTDACDMLFPLTVLCRRRILGTVYLADFTDEKAKSLKSLTDCYDYVISTCDSDDLFGHLTIFERMFATCSFVIEFCIRIHQYGIVDVVKYGHMFWAMYFDKFSEEFYKEGGWDKLKEVARPYFNIYDILFYFDVRELHTLGRAIEDYNDFMENDQYVEFKYKQKKIHVSKLWVKYHVEQFKSFKKIPLTFQYYVEASDIEELLENLKCLFRCFAQNYSISMESSESDDYDAYLDNLNAHEVLSTNQMNESCYRKSPPYSVPDTKNVCFEKECVKGNVEEEARTENILGVNCSSKNGDDKNEIAIRTEIVSTNRMAKSELDGNSFSRIAASQTADNLYSGNTEMQCATPIAPEALYKTKTDVSICCRKPPPYSVLDRTNFSSKKNAKGSVEEVSIKKTTSKNGDDQKEIPMRTEIMSTSQTADTESNGKCSRDILPPRQVLDTYMENLSLRNEEFEIMTAPETLSTMQKDISCYRKPLQYSDLYPPNFSSEKVENSSFGEVRIEKGFEANFLKNGDRIGEQFKIPQKTEIVSTSYVSKSELNGHSQHIPTKTCISNLYSGNMERLSETLYTPEALSKNQMEVSICYPKPPSYDLLDTTNFSSEKRGSFEEVHIEKIFGLNDSSSNVEDQSKITERTKIISGSQMTKSELDARTALDILPIPKGFDPENRWENTNNEMEIIQKAREDLRNEQNGHDIKIFLRMILVLDDRQGTKFVLQAMHNNKDGLENTQVTRKKQKKKHKKNKSEI